MLIKINLIFNLIVLKVFGHLYNTLRFTYFNNNNEKISDLEIHLLNLISTKLNGNIDFSFLKINLTKEHYHENFRVSNLVAGNLNAIYSIDSTRSK